jgi:membrane-bound inhibitor of C-type lysozyme
MKFCFLLLLIGGLSSSCSIDKLPLSGAFSKDTSKKTIQPEGSVEYNCAEKKTFFLSYLNEKKFVWLTLHNREFRLNQTDASPNIYNNDITTLEIGPEITQIKNEKEILYAQCIEKKDAS